MKAVLISTYDLGHQPFGLASPAAWLGAAGADVVCLDLAVEPFRAEALAGAGLVAVHVPMHTATRLAAAVVPRIHAAAPEAHLCFYGLYAPMNARFLRRLGAQTLLGGEFESGLAALYRRLAGAEGNGGDEEKALEEEDHESHVSLAKQRFLPPDRRGLPELAKYAHLHDGEGRRHVAGYTEASRGCKHLCRHCPVVPVYGGRFRVVQPEVVLADVRQQVAAGATHVTFGDPDFFNGVGHAMRLVAALHAEFSALTFDVTIKVEHLLRHARHLPGLVESGCLFVTTAVESVDDTVLARLDKGHDRADFVRLVALARDVGLALAPTFLPFTPWTTLAGYRALLTTLVDLDLVDWVAPVQLAIRLLVPAGSRVLALPEVRACLEGFDSAALSYRWRHPDPRVDELQSAVQAIVEAADETQERWPLFAEIWRLAHAADGLSLPPPAQRHRPPVPRLSEPWYCCAEPTPRQLEQI